MNAFAILLSLACVTATADQAPVFQSETKVVLVDAVVTGKKGDYVRDLTAKDFRVWQDNQEQTIRSFSVETDSSAAEPRRLVLFFDNTGMRVIEQAGVRQVAASFLDTNAGPNRLMAVVDFDGGFRVAQSFTENAGRLKDAVRGVRFNTSDPGGAGALSGGRMPVFAQDAANAPGLMQSIGSLARSLNALPGRKIIVLFTGGVAFATAPPAAGDDLIQICNRSNVGLYPVMQAVAQDLSTNPLTPGGVRSPVPVSTVMGSDIHPAGSLPFTIARGTGGFVVSGSNNLLAELQRIVGEQNQSYVLGFTPPDSSLQSKEGTCHTLRVKVDRGGTEVRSRSSYCASKAMDLLAESRTEQDLEKRAAAAQTGSAASIQAPFFYVRPGVARVHVAMEIATEALKFENQKGRLHMEMNVLGIASGPDGGTAARFSDIVKRDFENQEAVDKWKARPLYYAKEFRILAGQYKLTVVFSSGGASFGKADTSLIVPARDRGQFAISALALSKAVRPASALGLEASLIDEGTPLIGGGAQVFPAGTTEFSRSEQLFCYFELYTSEGAGPANVHLRILDKTGAPKWDSGTAQLGPAEGGKAMIPVGLNVPITSLPSGYYRLEAMAKDGADKPAIQAMNFAIK